MTAGQVRFLIAGPEPGAVCERPRHHIRASPQATAAVNGIAMQVRSHKRHLQG